MKYRQLGSSDLHVSEISLGSWLTYGVGVEREKAAACVDKAFDVGINFIDTANVYGRGAAESFLGETLAGRPRDSYVLATKVFFPMSDTDRGLSRAQIEKQLDASLQRLKVDHVDLYQCHRYDDATPLEETMEALTAAVRAGKTRWLGFSEWPADKIRAALGDGAASRSSSPASRSIRCCGARRRRRSSRSAPPMAYRRSSGPRSARACSPASIRPTRRRRRTARAASDSMSGFIGRLMQKPVLEAVQKLKPLAAEAGVSLTRFALAWVLREPNVASAIVGASSPAQVEENAGASGLSIDPALFAKAEAIVAAAR